MSSDKFWKGQVESMKIKRQFTCFEKVIDRWNREKLKALDTNDYITRLIFAEFTKRVGRVFT